MFKIETFSLGPLQTNAYLLYHEDTNEGIIIDPGMNPEPLLKRCSSMKIAAIVLTHAHFDHIGGVEAVRAQHACPVYVHPLEQAWLTNPELNGSLRWPMVTGPIATQPAEHTMEDGDVLELLGEKIQVLHTPGHSPGSVSLLIGNDLFGGDVLFYRSVGRTDLPGGDPDQLYDSIHSKLFVLDGCVRVYPGHGPDTSIGFEQEHNPYV